MSGKEYNNQFSYEEIRTEIWKEIKDYEGLYEVSNLGRVKSLGNDKNRKEKILKPAKNKCGYYTVCLCQAGKQKRRYLQRLVAIAFVHNDDPEHKNKVNHKNEIKSDNRVTNLEWMSCEENINYGTHNKRVAESNSIPINQFSKDGVFIKTWKSAIEAERAINILNSNICHCLKGRSQSAGGYKWEYAS